jgi:predicted peptidase
MGLSGIRTLIRGCSFAVMLTLTVFLTSCSSMADLKASAGFVERDLILRGVTYRYQVFVPARRDRHDDVPVILFLHGTGERGSDGDKPTRVGLGPYLRAHADDFPAIVVFPQAPDDSDWKGMAAEIAFAALDAATQEFGGDRDRSYLTGLSMGGYGAWELALMQPKRFAAVVPVCGALTAPRDERDLYVTPLHGDADPPATLAQRLKHLPVWIFHGAKDDLVPPREDRLIAAAFRAVGGDVRYTEFPDANHNSWDPAYSQTPELWPWLFAQRRK